MLDTNQNTIKLSQKEEALFPIYLEKWASIPFSSQPINPEKATQFVKDAYVLMGEKKPEIIFANSPQHAWEIFNLQGNSNILAKDLRVSLDIRLKIQISNKIKLYDLCKYFNILSIYRREGVLSFQERYRKFILIIINKIISETKFNLSFSNSFGFNPFYCGFGLDAALIEYVVEVLGGKIKENIWQIYQGLISNCGWILPARNVCIICHRPVKILFDNQQELHGEGEAAIEYQDGFKIYANHGVSLPQKYGEIHPKKWHSTWLIEEENAEIKRVLIQGIGYEKICQELKAKTIDSWQEYTLLEIVNQIDIETIHLLKMTCPSTGFIHVLRVPPNIKSARNAICWINWGIDYEKFSIQT